MIIQAKNGTKNSMMVKVKYKRTLPEKNEWIEIRPKNWEKSKSWDSSQDRNGWVEIRVMKIKEAEHFKHGKFFLLSK